MDTGGNAGTDNAIYRLGEDMVVRLPRRATAARAVTKEQRWLPLLAPLLPLAIPVPIGEGLPGEGFPYPWSVYRWLDGENAVDGPPQDLRDTARQLGRFIAALHRVDAVGGPPSFRGGPVNALDADVRTAIQALGTDGMVDANAATSTWEAALRAPRCNRPPVWVHADLYPTNLVTSHGRLVGVIDFGGLGVGDPACDMLPAWALLSGQARELFRAEVSVDDATWARGRGWGLAIGLGAAHVYRVTNPVLATLGRRAIADAIADWQR
jgi:aminoglycoside phosphotransferase (APT) family kinase protein